MKNPNPKIPNRALSVRQPFIVIREAASLRKMTDNLIQRVGFGSRWSGTAKCVRPELQGGRRVSTKFGAIHLPWQRVREHDPNTEH